MRLPLAEGNSYRTASLAASAQECKNLYAESIETATGSGKGNRYLTATPGLHLLVNITTHAGNVRGIASGGGRMFVCVGAYVYEINNAGATVGTPSNLLANDGLPVQMFFNGNQLGIVANGYFYYDNGTGATLAHFQTSGTVTVVGTAVTWRSGDIFVAPFPTAMYINGIAVAVSAFVDSTHVTLSSAFPGSGTGVVTTFFNQVYWVSGDKFSSGMIGLPITINGQEYTVGALDNDSVMFLETGQDAGRQIAVAYSAVLAPLPYTAADGAFVTAVTGAYLDSQMYIQRPAGGTPDLGRQVNFSGVNDFTSWMGLDFFSKDSAADHIQSILAHNKQLIVWGQQFGAEVWQNDPNTGRPVLISGMVFAQPSACRYAPVVLDDRVYFVGGPADGGMVAYRVDGSVPTRISTHAVEEQWKLSGVAASAIVGWGYEDDGHFFWVVCFSSGSAWVYDVTEKFWHERAAWTGSAFAAYKGWFHTYIPEWTANSGALQGLHIVGDHASGKLYIMSTTYYDEESADVKRIRALPYLFNGGRRVFCGRFQLTQAAGATVNLDWSSDDGASFTTVEPGSDTTSSPYWLAQGSFERSAIPRLSVTGQTAVVLIDVDAEIDYGTS